MKISEGQLRGNGRYPDYRRKERFNRFTIEGLKKLKDLWDGSNFHKEFEE
jgi:hypothetical protein